MVLVQNFVRVRFAALPSCFHGGPQSSPAAQTEAGAADLVPATDAHCAPCRSGLMIGAGEKELSASIPQTGFSPTDGNWSRKKGTKGTSFTRVGDPSIKYNCSAK